MPCQLEHGHRLDQLLGLNSQALSRSSALFHQGRVLLGHPVHLLDGLTDLLNTATLLGASPSDLVHDGTYALNRSDDFFHGLTSSIDQ